MKFNRAPWNYRFARRGRAGFTLTEVLAALAFMAIVIPVAVEGVRIANLAGQVGLRKTAAARVAERVMNEMTVTGGVQSMNQNGRVREGFFEYAWSSQSGPWTDSSMRLLTVVVMYQVQGREYDVSLSTLMDGSTL